MRLLARKGRKGVALALGVGCGSHASGVRAEPHRVCLYLDIGATLWDASPRAADGESFYEEYGRNEGPTSYPAQRWLARVRDESADDVVFWAATFAEERFASVGEQPLDETRIYVGYDPQNVLPGATQADRTFGNQPSVVIDGDSWHSKFTVAHELGHQQTIAASQASFGPADLDYCYDPTVYPVAPVGCVPNHTLSTHEWQAAAAIEGIAHWYAVAVWNDVDLVECQACQAGVRYVSPSAPDQAQVYAVPRETQLCTALNEPQCPAGVGNEWDWLSAFRLFRLDAPTTPSFRTMLTMLSAFHASGNWNTNLATDAFWMGLDQMMAGHLGTSHAAWQAAAMQMELDR